MSCGYACVGCGKCRGKPKELRTTPTCPRCGYLNEVSASVCVKCGMKMPKAAGTNRLLAELANPDSDTALASDSDAALVSGLGTALVSGTDTALVSDSGSS